MSRYFTARKALWVADDLDLESVSPRHLPTVCDHHATDTGLLDLNGDPIMRAPRPIGFGRDAEW